MNENSPGVWRPQPGASQVILRVLVESAPIPLPPAYLEQLASSNGRGTLEVEPGWIAIWPAEEVLGLNVGYAVAASLPGFFGFGTNGGGELFAFDTRRPPPFPIVMVPFIPMNVREATHVAESFAQLRQMIGRDWANA